MPRESLADAVARLREAGIGDEELRRRGCAARGAARADRAPDRGDPPHDPPGPPAPRGRAAPARRSRAAALDAEPHPGADRRGGDDPLADGRGALAPAARRGRDPPRALVRRGEPVAGAAAARPRAARRDPGCAAAAPARHVDRRRHGRQPERGRGDDRRRARAGADARARARPAGGARARLGLGHVVRDRRRGARARSRRATSRTATRSCASGTGWPRTSTATPRSSAATSPASTRRCALTAPPGSPTARSPTSARASRCSACTWRRSTCASTRSEVRDRAERVVAAFEAAATARERHGPRCARARDRLDDGERGRRARGGEARARRRSRTSTPCRCSRRSPISAAPARSRASCSTRARGRGSR